MSSLSDARAWTFYTEKLWDALGTQFVGCCITHTYGIPQHGRKIMSSQQKNFPVHTNLRLLVSKKPCWPLTTHRNHCSEARQYFHQCIDILVHRSQQPSAPLWKRLLFSRVQTSKRFAKTDWKKLTSWGSNMTMSGSVRPGGDLKFSFSSCQK